MSPLTSISASRRARRAHLEQRVVPNSGPSGGSGRLLCVESD
jgi:hypothetical protein